MRRINDPNSYVPKQAAAAALREAADFIEHGDPTRLVKWYLNTWSASAEEVEAALQKQAEKQAQRARVVPVRS